MRMINKLKIPGTGYLIKIPGTGYLINYLVKYINCPRNFQEKTRTGKPCGDEDFYDKIMLLTGINYKNKKAGLPKKY